MCVRVVPGRNADLTNVVIEMVFLQVSVSPATRFWVWQVVVLCRVTPMCLAKVEGSNEQVGSDCTYGIQLIINYTHG